MRTGWLRPPWPKVFPVLLLILAACQDQPIAPHVDPGAPEPPGSSMTPVGLIEIRLNAIGTPDFNVTAGPPAGLSLDLVAPKNANDTGDGTIQVERVSSGAFTEGGRTDGGQRYFTATFRVRNAQSNRTAYDTPRTNLTFLAARTASSKKHSAISQMTRFDNTAADTALAAQVIPTGAVVMSDSGKMVSTFADVIQVLTEAEAAAVPLKPGILEVFPWGFMVRNPKSASSRTLPASPAPDQFDGLVTFAFRIPLQPTPAQDPYNLAFLFMAVDDSETRLTESIEEQDSAGHARARTRALALGATVTTVLNGSPFTDYPGQRQICSPRVSGPTADPSEIVRMNAVGMYSRVAIFGPGQALDPCAANFRSGSFSPLTGDVLGLNVKYAVTFRAMDRYGNLRPVTDTIRPGVVDGTTAPTLPAQVVLVGGVATDTIRFASYGATTSTFLVANSRRQGTRQHITVGGVNRTWTGGAGTTSWNTGANWNVGAEPASRDTVLLRDDVGTGVYPVFTESESVAGVQVLDVTAGGNVPSIGIGPFELTASGDVRTTNSSSITATSGSVVLAGASRTVAGQLPSVRVTGFYSLNGNLTIRPRLRIELGRLTSTGFRVSVQPQ